MSAPLVVTGDDILLDELQRLAAAAGVTPDVARDPASALRGWLSAPLVLVGADLASGLTSLEPARRAGVHVVTWGSGPSDIYRTAVELGAEEVLTLPPDEEAAVHHLADLGDSGRDRAVAVGVLGGSGGAGATTFACALAQVAARDGTALVVDADPVGPGLDRVLGMEHVEGVRWETLARSAGRLGARALREAVPRREGLGVLTWAAAGGALADVPLRDVLSAGVRGHDTVVVDVPRRPDPDADELLARCDDVLVVVPATVSGVASAGRLLTGHPCRDRMRLVIRGSALDPRTAARVLGLPVAATMRDERRLAESLDLGLGPVRSPRDRLGRAATEVLRRISARAVPA